MQQPWLPAQDAWYWENPAELFTHLPVGIVGAPENRLLRGATDSPLLTEKSLISAEFPADTLNRLGTRALTDQIQDRIAGKRLQHGKI